MAMQRSMKRNMNNKHRFRPERKNITYFLSILLFSLILIRLTGVFSHSI